MGALPQALEIILKVQRKTSHEKNKLSNLQYMFFFFIFSLLFGPPPIFKSYNFLISYSFQMI
jgi:hypothetical protein